jgi:tagatose 1,6-diphosphate aldolase
MEFEFLQVKDLVDRDLIVRINSLILAVPEKDYVPAYKFDLYVHNITKPIGRVFLRIGDTANLILYGGHFGYEVEPDYRGQHYAARACQLVLPVAYYHGINEIWITCNPENRASRRTCELIGARLIEVVELPQESDMYQKGERYKCRYLLNK